MDTLHDRLEGLAQDAPTGGAPAAELWARGKRTHRIRAAALAVTMLVVGAVGTGIGVRLVDGDGSQLRPVVDGNPLAISLPIEYPVGEGAARSRGHSRAAGGDLGVSSRWRRRARSRRPRRGNREVRDAPDRRVASGLRGSVTPTSRCRPMAAGSPTPPRGRAGRPRSGERRELRARVQNFKPTGGTPGSMPPTWSAKPT